MKPLSAILLLIACLVIIPSQAQTPQERLITANCLGERVIQDYLSFYETQQKAYPILYYDTHLWFEDSDTRQMAADYINSHVDSVTTDTIFFIHRRCQGWGETNYLEIVPGDTVFGLRVKWLDGGYRSFEADKTPFLNVYSKTYWEDLCKWDTAHISKPIEYVVNDGCYYYLVRLIYHNGLLVSAEYCDHDDKIEYDGLWYDPKKDVRVPYPEGKQWPKIF